MSRFPRSHQLAVSCFAGGAQNQGGDAEGDSVKQTRTGPC